ncbi:hypothetical protein [Leptospira mayottensis]|uniref:Uncharacterized protein n=2 Tax=Leptospira mayottensis TaxID=1137606 RepID=A0AA87MSS8_9LEPT|nr:hypothetical protein [Leptospira mayottensis]AXR61917.1 hypothetical protein DQM68_15770 [Leptospira mayottensis]AXR65829.1 hypothetical protein DQM28_18090 [Leptospira mayottensis]AZQ01632.1 hypothetical protein LEP1GSC190_05950 [Leptospira mayottensis 200901116]EKS01857.1 hypothetical protein LEP1GSC125_4008 [Leptospira mayottensis 200901122]TGM95329.1 hypothetical protein EHR03_16805 [Leptospira mayottensis]
MNFLSKRSLPRKICGIFFFLGLTLSYGLISGQGTTQSETNLKKIEIRAGKIFLAGHTGDHSKDTAQILLLIKNLVEDTVGKNFSKLPDQVSPKDGLLLDLKGIWTREEIKKELSKKGNYFETYFFERELLKKQKNSENVRTVRDLFLLSGGIEVEFYYESMTECELKLKFKDNIQLEKELINPYFKKVQGKWYLHRMF